MYFKSIRVTIYTTSCYGVVVIITLLYNLQLYVLHPLSIRLAW